MKPTRAEFLRIVLAQEGLPYKWSAKGEIHRTHDGREARCFDCSGLVTWSLKKAGGPDWRWFHNCRKLWKKLPAVEHPEPGDLAFYGPKDSPSHVMVVTAVDACFGASGGDSSTVVPGLNPRARVQARPAIRYRPDFIGFRRLPFAPKE